MFKRVRLLRFLSPLLLLFVLLLICFSGVKVIFAAASIPALVGPKKHYLALGDSLAFGYQIDKDYFHGYARDYLAELKGHGVRDMFDIGCPGETSTTLIRGGCPVLPKFMPSQLSVALLYLKTHRSTVSPVTLDVGANDMLNDINPTTCVMNTAQYQRDLALLDANLRQVILPKLHAALTVQSRTTGDLLIMNYYDPYQNICPGQLSYTLTLNQHLANDVQGYGTIVNVFDAFGGASVPNVNLCSYTWMCHNPADVHPTDRGYQVIANTFRATTGY
jgi:lysophospholipase L1-like esterase